MAVSFQSIAQQCATFYADEGIATGIPCMMETNAKVCPCDMGETFIGVILDQRAGRATVALTGFVELTYSGTAPQLGYCTLAGDGNGGICVEGEKQYFVVSVDANSSKAVILL